MPQKLSAMNYIKNNRRRISVLIIALSLCFMMTYLTQFLLSTTEETFRSICTENTQKMQYIFLTGGTLKLDTSLDMVDYLPIYEQANRDVAERLKNHEGVKDAYYAQILYMKIIPMVGQMTVEIPLVPAEALPLLVGHMDAVLVEGRMPEKPGEIMLDKASMMNNGYMLGDYFDRENIGTAFQIVGILNCDKYFGCGIPYEEANKSLTKVLTVISEGIEDISLLLAEEGIEVRENYETIVDHKWGTDFLQTEVVDVIGYSRDFIYVGVILLLAIALIIVYTMYLRDRHEEWCLYSSIGYARRTIYSAILRELLFTFVAAVVIGGVSISIAVIWLDAAMIQPNGLKCRYFSPSTLGEILCSYVMILGILQIPVRYALHKIRTVDALEEDMY